MPDSFKDYTVGINENTPSVSFENTDFEYLETAHIKVVATDTVAATEVTYAQSDDGSGDIVFGDIDTSAPPFTVAVSNGTTTVTFGNITFPNGTNKLRVKRVTPRSSLLTTFNNASLLRADDLNNNSKQLLFTLQEQVDIGIGSLPLDADNKFNAGTRSIKNLIDPVGGTEVATKAYVDALTSFSTNPTSVPRAYAFTIGDMDVSTNDLTKLLSPTPLSTVNEMFIVSIQGVIQQPNTDFSVTSAGLLTITNAKVELDAGNLQASDKITVICFGNSKAVFPFPVTGTAASASETPLTLKGAGSQTADLFKVVDSTDTELAKIASDGDVTCVDVNCTDIACTDITASGNTAITGTLGAGSTTVTGTLAVSSNATVSGDLNVAGNVNITGGVNAVPVGAILPYGGATAPDGFRLCDGAEVLVGDTALDNLLDGAYGTGSNGRSLTPNLQEKFPMGMSGSLNRGNTGGGTVTLAEENLPAHTHDDGSFKAREHKHHVVANTQVSGAVAALSSTTQLPQARTTGSDAEYGFRSTSIGATIGRSSIPIQDGSKVTSSGLVDVTGDSGSTGSGTAFDVTPAYVVLNYIIKT